MIEVINYDWMPILWSFCLGIAVLIIVIEILGAGGRSDEY
jgi:hypothetical protein